MNAPNIDQSPIRVPVSPDVLSGQINSPDKLSPITGTYEAANRFSTPSPIQSISAEAGNFIIQKVNNVAEEVRNNSDAFANNALYSEVVKLQQAHPNLFRAIDIPMPALEKHDKAEKKDSSHGHGEDEHSDVGNKAPEQPKFDMSKFTQEELFVLDGVTRLITQDLAADAGVEIVNKNIPIKLNQDHEDHWDEVTFFDMIRIGIKPPHAPDNYDLLDEHGHVTGTSLEALKAQFRARSGRTESPYTKAIRFGERDEQQKLREIAEMHNANIALRESYVGQPVWETLGQLDKNFTADRLTIKINTEIDRLLAVQHPGKTLDQLVDPNGNTDVRDRLQRQALINATIDMGKRSRSVYEGQAAGETTVADQYIERAKGRAEDIRKTPTRTEKYRKKVRQDDGSYKDIDIDAAEYAALEQTISASKTRLVTYVDEKTLQSEIKLLNATIVGLQEKALDVPNDVEPIVASKQILENEEKQVDKKINAITSYYQSMGINFGEPDATTLANRITAFRRKLNLSADAAKKLDLEIGKWQAEYPQNQRALQELNDKKQQIGDLRVALSQKEGDLRARQQLEEELKNTLIESYEVHTSEQADKIDFILGKEGNEKTPPGTYTKRVNHTMEMFLEGEPETRARAVESLDNFRNVIFEVEGDIDGQKMAAKVLPDHILIPSLLQAMDIPASTVQEWLGPNYRMNFLNPDGSFKMTSAKMRNAGPREFIFSELKKNLLWRMQHNTSLTNANIGRALLKERLIAASTEDGLDKLARLKVQTVATPGPPRRTPPPAPPTAPTTTPPPATPPPGAVPPTPGAPIPPSVNRPGLNRFLFPNRGAGGGTP